MVHFVPPVNKITYTKNYGSLNHKTFLEFFSRFFDISYLVMRKFLSCNLLHEFICDQIFSSLSDSDFCPFRLRSFLFRPSNEHERSK